MTDHGPAKGMTASRQAEIIDAVLLEATLEEKIGMMSGRGFLQAIRDDQGVWAARPYRAGGGIERLGVPAWWFTDGPRGVARGQSTAFPCTMARGASFDVDLERRIGEAMGIEIRAQGCNLSGAVCINLLRHPAWGRAQETYGEDSMHLGAMGSALSAGIQTHNVAATVKHFALNSIENTRFTVNVTIDERALREVYLPHFKKVIDAGCATVMSAYNKMNGEYCGQNADLLTTILRDEWGFAGFVHSDWLLGVYQPYGATAGLDVENPEPVVFGKRLQEAVETGTIAASVIDKACRRILSVLYRISCAPDPLPEYPETLVASERHRLLAREAAEKTAVLLKNNGILPLDRSKVRKLAVLGRLAALENTGDNGSSKVRAPYIVTPIAGLGDYLGQERILTGDETDLEEASRVAAQADAVVVIVGYTADDEGEYIPGDLGLVGLPDNVRDMLPERPKDGKPARGGDRASLDLPVEQIALIRAATQSGKPVAVVLVAGSAVMVEDWHEEADAIMQTFYAGMEGGTALARLLFGEANPSGRLPFTVARDVSHYPWFDRTATEVTYDLWHGYTKLARDGNEPRYPFGHGLSYAEIRVQTCTAQRINNTVNLTATISNESNVACDAVVQFYARCPSDEAERADRQLVAFAKVTIGPFENQAISASVLIDDLRYFAELSQQWIFVSGNYDFYCSQDSTLADSAHCQIELY